MGWGRVAVASPNENLGGHSHPPAPQVSVPRILLLQHKIGLAKYPVSQSHELLTRSNLRSGLFFPGERERKRKRGKKYA